MPDNRNVPDLTFHLYDGKVTIDFYEKYVMNGHAYKHIYINRNTGKWPISVTGATSVVDKSTPLGIWQERLAREHLQKLIADNKKVILTDEIILEATSLYRVRRDEGASTGDIVHKWIEQYIAGKKPELPNIEAAVNGISGFLDWVEKNDVEFLKSESIVYSKKNDYVGKIDVAIKAKIPTAGNKKLVHLLDFKTNNWSLDKKTGIYTSRVYSEQRYQQAGYKIAIDEETPGYLTGHRLLLAINKIDGNFKVHDLDEIDEHYPKDAEAFLHALGLRRREKELSKY